MEFVGSVFPSIHPLCVFVYLFSEHSPDFRAPYNVALTQPHAFVDIA